MSLKKGCFANNIEQFWNKMQDKAGVKNCKLFEGISPSLAQGFTPCCNLAKRILKSQNCSQE